MDATILIAVLDLAARYGAPAVIEGIRALQKDAVTLADVRALEGLVQRPETYFKTPDEAA